MAIIPHDPKADRVLYAVPHHYSCGGYWLAYPCGDDNEFWRISPEWGQGTVLSEYQVAIAQANIQSRQTGRVTVEFVDQLPAGAKIINARGYRSAE